MTQAHPRWRAVLGAVLALLLTAPAADACPVCRRPTGRAVRAGIFNASFGPRLVATAAPFGLLLGLAAVLHGGPAPRPSRRRHERDA